MNPTHFILLELVLKQAQKKTDEWDIDFFIYTFFIYIFVFLTASTSESFVSESHLANLILTRTRATVARILYFKADIKIVRSNIACFLYYSNGVIDGAIPVDRIFVKWPFANIILLFSHIRGNTAIFWLVYGVASSNPLQNYSGDCFVIVIDHI